MAPGYAGEIYCHPSGEGGRALGIAEIAPVARVGLKGGMAGSWVRALLSGV